MKIEGLAGVRRDRGLSQKELGRRLGMGQPRISNYEQGMSVSPRMAERIAAELGCSVEKIKSPEEPTFTFKLSELPEELRKLISQ